jgi:ATP-dependent Clp protease ATP-binding subunit ClpA
MTQEVHLLEEFTQKASNAIEMSQEEARRLGHNFVCTEQLLLGLIAEGTGSAARVLSARGVTLNDTRHAVEKLIQRGSGFVSVEIPFTDKAKYVIEQAHKEAKKLGLERTATEHLLLAVLNCSDGNAISVLQSLRVDIPELKQDTLKAASQRESARTIDHLNIGLVDQCDELIRAIDRVSRMSDKLRSGTKDLCNRSDIKKHEAEKIGMEIADSLTKVEEKLKELTKIQTGFGAEKKLVASWTKQLN